jgi:hypothetical protein
MNTVSGDTMSVNDHREAYMISIVAGVVVFVISIVLNFVGSTALPVGNMVPIPNGLGGYNYIPQEGYDYPYQSLNSVGRVFLVMGLALLTIGVLMARQRLMNPRKKTHNLSPYLIGSDAWKVDTMIESLGSSGHCSEVQTAGSALSSPADSESCVESSAEPKATSVQGPPSGPAESKYIRTRTGQTDLELHLSQLRFSRDNGLLTKQEYEEKKNQLMKELRVSLVAMDGPMSFKH